MKEVECDDEEKDATEEHQVDSSFAATDFQAIRAMLPELETVPDTDVKISAILQKYQEAPEFLDSHLEVFISSLMNLLERNMDNPELYHRIFKILYVTTKVRGYKVVVKFFPHEVLNLEPTLLLLTSQKFDDFNNWESRYVLFLWLSMIVLIPFDLTSVDSGVAVEHQTNLVQRLQNLGTSYLSDPGPVRDAAGILLARLFSRPDMQDLDTFLDFVQEVLASEKADIVLNTGVLKCLSELLNLAPREVMLKKVPSLYAGVARVWTITTSTLLRKMSVKVAQRIGLTFLKPKTASWRYNRGNRSLFNNSSNNGQDLHLTVAKCSDNVDNDDDIDDIPTEIEDVIQQLLTGLKDANTIVRWTAAKGIGRITMRLPLDFADDVVENILGLFSPSQSDGAWHGGCLALAELARRGLLLPARLHLVVPIVREALLYDKPVGRHSIGDHVRDAACYVCWAFARAYTGDIMQTYAEDLARSLIIVAVFDRAINCRRSASAAFQELVGRLGKFPHGIEIIQKADYFSVGNRSSAYLSIAVFVAQFAEYTIALISHLVEIKLKHWDEEIRSLSASALGKLVRFAPEHVIQDVLPFLIKLTLSKILMERHGATLAVGSIVVNLVEQGIQLSTDLQASIRNIIPKMEDHRLRLFTGKGGELLRGAVCNLIQCIAVAQLPLPNKTILRLQQSIDTNLSHPNEDISHDAVKACYELSHQYHTEATADRLLIVDRYVSGVKTSPNPAATRGLSLALGSLPFCLLCERQQIIIETLIVASQIQSNKGARDAETRRNAVNALSQIVDTLGIGNLCGFSIKDHKVQFSHGGVANTQVLNQIIHSYLDAMHDFCTDNRGDVGSWVREAAFCAISKAIIAIYTEIECISCIDSDNAQQVLAMLRSAAVEVCTLFFPLLITGMMEKINRMRAAAGKTFESLLHLVDPVIENIPHRKELLHIFPADLVLDWSAPSVTFPMLVRVLGLDTFRRSALEGISISAGGLTESLVRHAGESLKHYMLNTVLDDNQPANVLNIFASDFLSILNTHRLDFRVVIPTLNTLHLLLSNDVFLLLQPPTFNFGEELYRQVRREIGKSKDVKKLMAGTTVIVDLLQFPGPCTSKCLNFVLILLSHPYPNIRAFTAEKLYNCILMRESIVPSNKLDEIVDLLLSTAWNTPAGFNAALTLANLLGLNAPSVVHNKETKTKDYNKDLEELVTYNE